MKITPISSNAVIIEIEGGKIFEIRDVDKSLRITKDSIRDITFIYRNAGEYDSSNPINNVVEVTCI